MKRWTLFGARREVVLLALMTLASACGGSSAPAESAGQPTPAVHEHDWKEAARGHGAAGTFSAAELGDLEKRSTPGATSEKGASPDAGVSADAGARSDAGAR